jgi:hypothetical protein
MHHCPNCNSARIGRLRFDSDWGGGGDWSRSNLETEAEYTAEDLKGFEDNERPDIECLICCVCGKCFGA